jgi:aspartate/methionine/tyrosine aminotransferase
MSIKPASRLDSINEYYFSKKLKEIAALNLAGKNIINLGIGSPDLPPSAKQSMRSSNRRKNRRVMPIKVTSEFPLCERRLPIFTIKIMVFR